MVAVTFIEKAVIFIKEAITSIKGAVMSIGGAVTSISKGSLSVEGRSFKTAGVRVVDNIKGVNKRDLRWWLIIYKLKRPLLLIYSLISIFNYSIGLSLWAILYSTYSTNLLFLLKTHTLLCWSSCLSPISIDLLASLNICTLKLLKSS